MKKKEIKDLSVNDIRERIVENKALLNKLQIGHAVSPIENPLKMRATRRTIARMITELKTKENN